MAPKTLPLRIALILKYLVALVILPARYRPYLNFVFEPYPLKQFATFAWTHAIIIIYYCGYCHQFLKQTIQKRMHARKRKPTVGLETEMIKGIV